MSEESKQLRLTKDEEVVVRMYGQGFGDCFLLAFPREGEPDEESENGRPVYVVIDCGVFFRTPGQKGRMQKVVENIRDSTGGIIDLLVATHEHYDHLCGFGDAREIWKEIEVRQIWLAWTEDRSNPFAQEYTSEKETLARQVDAALSVAEYYGEAEVDLWQAINAISRVGLFGGAFLEGEESDRDEEVEPEGSTEEDPFALRAPRRVSKLPNNVLFDLANEPGSRFKAGDEETTCVFCEPAQVRRVPGSTVDAYVLGPPTDPEFLGIDLIESEVYSDHVDDHVNLQDPVVQAAIRLKAAGNLAARRDFGEALVFHCNNLAGRSGQNGHDEGAIDEDAPFNLNYCTSLTLSESDPFFKDNYFNQERDQRIDTDWLDGAGSLALQLDKLTNNTSLALAFRLPNDRYLLFPGDAQVGNWLSWHTIKPSDWYRPGGGKPPTRPRAKQILERTAVYKVGHHGSHNATLKENGLEMMENNFIAFVPSSQHFPQKEMSTPWKIPFDVLKNRLVEKTNNQVIYPHEAPAVLASGATIERADPALDLPAMQRNELEEGPVPLWRQVRI